MRGADTCRTTSGRNSAAGNVTYNTTDQEDEGGNDDARQVTQDDILEEDVDLNEAQHIKGCDEEHNNDKPLHESADEGARVEADATAVEEGLQACAAESLINLKRAENLSDSLTQESADEPAYNEDDEGDN